MTEDTIKMSEWLAEIDSLIEKQAKPKLRLEMSDIQFECIHKMRTTNKPVVWHRIRKWWIDKGFGEIQESTLKCRYFRECGQREIQR